MKKNTGDGSNTTTVRRRKKTDQPEANQSKEKRAVKLYSASKRWLFLLNNIPGEPSFITTADLHAAWETEYEESGCVSKRMMQRDLENLHKVMEGDLLCTSQGRECRWSLARNAKFRIERMDIHAAMAFDMTRKFLQPLLPKSSFDTLQPYFDAATLRLKNEPGRAAAQWSGKVRLYNRGFTLQPAVIDPVVMETVNQAMLNNRALLITRYRGWDIKASANNLSEEIMLPRGLVHDRATVYLVAEKAADGYIHRYPLHRIQNAEELNQRVYKRDDFNLDNYLRDNFKKPVSENQLRLVVRFTKEAGRHLLETPLSDDQEVLYSSDDEDNSFSIRATVADTRELRWWLLGFDENVEVREPYFLREEIKEKIAAMHRLYGLDREC